MHEQLYQDLEILDLRYEATRLQIRLIEYFVKTKKLALAAAMRDANSADTTALLTEAKELLGHVYTATTMAYAKVDLASLRELVVPFGQVPR